jgi:Fic family protein
MMAYDRNQPYNDLPQLPPAEDLMEDIDILKALISANRELAKVNGQLEKLPNSTMLINTLGLQEAKASSQIENIHSSDDELYRAISTDDKLPKIDANTKEVLRYREALWTGFNDLKKEGQVSQRMILDIFQKIKKTEEGIRMPATRTIIRRGDSDLRPGEVVYTPPRGTALLEGLLANLIEYLNTDDGVDPLIKMAISHYQFESIHPFSDGNGRTGRILNLLYLVQAGLLSEPNLYLSRQIIASKDDYYNHLGGVRQFNSFKKWVLYMLDVVEKTSQQTSYMVDDIIDQMEATLEYGKETLDWYSKEVNEILYTQPYSKLEHLAGVLNRTAPNTLRKYMKELIDSKIVWQTQNWKEVYYMNNDLIRILEN